MERLAWKDVWSWLGPSLAVVLGAVLGTVGLCSTPLVGRFKHLCCGAQFRHGELSSLLDLMAVAVSRQHRKEAYEALTFVMLSLKSSCWHAYLE